MRGMLRSFGLSSALATGCASASPTTPVAEWTVPLVEAATAAAVPVRPPPPETIITVSAVGDCAIGDLHHGAGAPGSFAAELSAVADPMGYPFSGVSTLLAADDLTIANLEGTLTDETSWHNPVFSIRGKPELAAVLARGSVELVDLENNHAMDYGPAGYEDTKAALTAAGVEFFGRDRVDRRTIEGMRLVNLGYLGGPSGTLERMIADVTREAGPGVVVIVSFHWGIEGYYATAPDQQRLGRAAIDAGADLVLGHHPHVLQGIETYRGRHVVYSLGNFVFGANSRPADMDSIIVQERFVIEAGAVARVEQRLVPVRISSSAKRNDFRPTLLDGAEAERVLEKVAGLSAKLHVGG